MATQTAHFELEKPALTDVADIAVLNNNFDDIDVVMFANQERSVAAVSNQADAYDAAQTYAVGDLVIHEDKLYKCVAAVTVAEPWDSTKWTQTTLAESGGTKVEANPVGAAGDTLETIDINGTIYDVGGGKIIHLTQAQYDALPATKESDDKLYLITDTNGDGSHFQPVIYSFEEREIGVWTDGKPLYEKSVNFGILPNATNKSVAHNISNLDDVCFINAIANNGSGAYIPIPFVSKSGIQYQLTLNVTSTDIVISSGDNFTNYAAIVTLQYTKTTDTPGSGTWTPQGVPALHYSTDEHVIGTWIDGKTLYEKSFEYTITSTIGSGQTQLISIPGISTKNNIVGCFINLTDSRVFPIPYVYGTKTAVLFYNENEYVTLRVADDTWGTGYKICFTIQYTKSTD